MLKESNQTKAILNKRYVDDRIWIFNYETDAEKFFGFTSTLNIKTFIYFWKETTSKSLKNVKNINRFIY